MAVEASQIGIINMNRRGKFVLTGELFYQETFETLEQIMAGIVVVHTEANLFDNTITYYAISSVFDELQDGELVPYYEPVIIEDEDGVEIRWERIKE
jgi:hypothetical protein